MSAFERHVGAIASQFARREVSVICNGATDWATLASQGRFDGRRVWGYVTWQWFHEPDRSVFGPIHYAQLSEQACWYLDEFWGAPDKRAVTVGCRVGTRTVGACPEYRATLMALQTLSHESMHLQGIRNEGLAECYGMQLLDDAARWLGADLALSRQLARNYWSEIYRKRGPRSSYYRTDCVDGRELDLLPGSNVWPAG